MRVTSQPPALAGMRQGGESDRETAASKPLRRVESTPPPEAAQDPSTASRIAFAVDRLVRGAAGAAAAEAPTAPLADDQDGAFVSLYRSVEAAPRDAAAGYRSAQAAFGAAVEIIEEPIAEVEKPSRSVRY